MLQQQTEQFEIERNADEDNVVDRSFATATETDVGTEVDNNTDIPTNSRQRESVPPARMDKKRKLKEKGASEEEKTLKVIGQYFENKASRSSSAHAATSHEGDEDDVFCKLLAIEMRKVKNSISTLRHNMKRKLMDLIMDIQERQEEEEKRQSDLQQQDHINMQGPQQLYTWMICSDQSAQHTQQEITQSIIPEEMQFEHEP